MSTILAGLLLTLTCFSFSVTSRVDRKDDLEQGEIIKLLRHQSNELLIIKVQFDALKKELHDEKLKNKLQKEKFEKEIAHIKEVNFKQQEKIQKLEDNCLSIRHMKDSDDVFNKVLDNGSSKSDFNSSHANDTNKKRADILQTYNNAENAMFFNDVRKRLLQPGVTTSSPRPGIVAFSAYMSQNEVHVVDHHTLIFDTVQVNEGGGYFRHTGAFIAPVSGIYVLTYTLVMASNSEVCTDLVINGKVYGHVYSYSGNLNVLETGTSVVLAQLIQGQSVFVRTATDGACGQTGKIYGDTWRRSSFAGWLLGY